MHYIRCRDLPSFGISLRPNQMKFSEMQMHDSFDDKFCHLQSGEESFTALFLEN